jgi:hypothetical protein
MPRSRKNILDLTTDEMNSIIDYIDTDYITLFNLCNVNKQFENYCKNSMIFRKKAIEILKNEYKRIRGEIAQETRNLRRMENNGIFQGQQYSYAHKISKSLTDHMEAHFSVLDDFITNNEPSYDIIKGAKNSIVLINKEINNYI